MKQKVLHQSKNANTRFTHHCHIMYQYISPGFVAVPWYLYFKSAVSVWSYQHFSGSWICSLFGLLRMSDLRFIKLYAADVE